MRKQFPLSSVPHMERLARHEVLQYDRSEVYVRRGGLVAFCSVSRDLNSGIAVRRSEFVQLRCEIDTSFYHVGHRQTVAVPLARGK